MSPLTICGGILISLALLVSSANGFCCYNNGHFGCCAYRPCNIFCCNCAGPRCRPNCSFDLDYVADRIDQTLFVFASGPAQMRGKRNAISSPDLNSNRAGNSQSDPDPGRAIEVDVPLTAFNRIDKNHDRFITYKEALYYYGNLTGQDYFLSDESGYTMAADDDFSSGFSRMDVNNDGVIEPHEFDSSLP